MFVDFWGVGATSVSAQRMTTDDVCRHLIADWIPSLPLSLGTSFIGWPRFLLESFPYKGRDTLTLSPKAGRSERQWKMVLSWMLGVAGTRHVLEVEGYRWIAPLSAFYPTAGQPIDLARWPASFPPGSVTAERDRNNRSRLRPDYVALRSTVGATGREAYEWAVAESKGTQRCLTSLTDCPRSWAGQVRNVEISVQGVRQQVPRHMVVATRVNPGAKYPANRRIQLRAWNRTEGSGALDPRFPRMAAPDIVAAHLYGLFHGLRLGANALALALSVQARSEVRQGSVNQTARRRVSEEWPRADDELNKRARTVAPQPGRLASRVMLVETHVGTIEVEIIEPLLTLAQKLQQAQEDEAAALAVEAADEVLNGWEHRLSTPHDAALRLLGVAVRLPRDF